MIEAVSLQNFQAHRRLRLEFDPGITTIVGRSDVGKSAIIRAIRWAATNQPGGDQFITTGTKGTTVTLQVDGHVIKRKRGGSVNSYHLDGEEYKAFGRGVPGPVVTVLNMGGVCWQGQHDAPFWFSETAGEVSRKLNSIVNLSIIDTTLANVQAENHAARVRLRDATEQEKAYAEAMNGLDGVPVMALAWHGVELAHENLDHKQAHAEELRERVEAADNARASTARAADMADSMAGVAVQAAAVVEQQNTRAALAAALRAAVQARQGAEAPVPDTAALRRAWNGLQEARAFHQDLIAIIGRCNDSDEKYQQAKQQAAQAEAELKEVGVCPTCKRSW